MKTMLKSLTSISLLIAVSSCGKIESEAKAVSYKMTCDYFIGQSVFEKHSQLDRCENQEAVCYVLYNSSISCFKK